MTQLNESVSPLINTRRDATADLTPMGPSAEPEALLTDYERLTPAQQEIFAAMDAQGSTHVNDRPEQPGVVFWEVALGVLGIMSLLVGVILVFFFAALGSIALVLGGMLCAMAFQGAHRASERQDLRDETPPATIH